MKTVTRGGFYAGATPTLNLTKLKQHLEGQTERLKQARDLARRWNEQKELNTMVAKINGLSSLGEEVSGLHQAEGKSADDLQTLLRATVKRIKDGMEAARNNVNNLAKTASDLEEFNAKFGNNPPS